MNDAVFSRSIPSVPLSHLCGTPILQEAEERAEAGRMEMGAWERGSIGVSECWSVGAPITDGKDGRNGTDWANGKSQMANGKIGAFAFLVIANRFRPPRKALVRSGERLGCEGTSFVSGAFFAFFFYSLEVVLFLLDHKDDFFILFRC